MDSPTPTRTARVGLWVAARQLLLVDAFFMIVAGILLVTAFSLFVPYNMDEFIHYSTLICHLFPQSDIGDGSCNSFDLLLPGTQWLSPIRAYHYSGSGPALYYLPLLLLWPSPLSVRFLGLIFLFFQAAILARVMGTRKWLPLVLLLSFYPYAFQQVVDTGPVGFHMLSIFLLYVLFEKWAKTLHPGYMVVSALLVAFCIWIKFSYFWLIPGIGILWILQVLRYKPWRLGRTVEILLQPLAAAALAVIPLIILLSSVNPQNPAEQPYLDELRHSGAHTVRDILVAIPWHETTIGQKFLHPLEGSGRIFVVQPAPEGADTAYRFLLYAFVPFFILLMLLVFRRPRGGIWVPLLLYLAFLSAVFMILRTQGSESMHHAILSMPFLVLAAGETVRLLRERHGTAARILRAAAMLWGALFVAVNLVYWAMTPSQPQYLVSDAAKDRLMYVLRDPEVAQRFVIVTIDWGVYFIQGLYGHPEQMLLWRWGVDPHELEQLRALAADHNRKLLFVHTQPETAADLSILRLVATQYCDAVPPDARWQIIGEPDPALTNVCQRVGRTGR